MIHKTCLLPDYDSLASMQAPDLAAQTLGNQQKEQDLELEIELQTKTVKIPVILNFNEERGEPSIGAIVMHGAGGDAKSGHLPQIAAALARAGVVCVRFTARSPNLGYRLSVCKALLGQLPALRQCAAVEQWILCGHSMGARVACQVAQDLAPLSLACILLSYPLHPPGKPRQLRDDPLAQLRLPLLLVRGTRDEFSQQEQWEQVTARMQSRRLQIHSVEGGDHGLKVKGREESHAALEAACLAVQCFAEEMAEQARARQGSRGAGGKDSPALATTSSGSAGQTASGSSPPAQPQKKRKLTRQAQRKAT